tara:strand:+ start:3678 stop:4244 length:567 start_codon:yes stop_codon:yes gene_type:complete
MSLGYGGAEWKTLAIRWSTERLSEEEKADLWERMSRVERRRFGKMLEDVEAKKTHSGDAFVTGRALAHYFGSYTEQTLMPIAANIDDMAREVMELRGLVDYLMLPVWRKWWVKASLRLTAFNQWLNRHGIRFVQLKEKETTDGELEVFTDTGARGSEHEGTAVNALEARISSPEPGLRGDGVEAERVG